MSLLIDVVFINHQSAEGRVLKCTVQRRFHFTIVVFYFHFFSRYNYEIIVRITADCPVIDPQVIDHVITKHLEADADYTSNTLEVPYPDGQDVEVFKFSALNKAWKSSSLASEREHVTPYIKFNEDGNYLINHSSSVLLLKDGKYLDRINHHAKYKDMFKVIDKYLR